MFFTRVEKIRCIYTKKKGKMLYKRREINFPKGEKINFTKGRENGLQTEGGKMDLTKGRKLRNF